jgi:hypothetical protein
MVQYEFVSFSEVYKIAERIQNIYLMFFLLSNYIVSILAWHYSSVSWGLCFFFLNVLIATLGGEEIVVGKLHTISKFGCLQKKIISVFFEKELSPTLALNRYTY